ncbi:phage tail protein [Variovorax sp. PAMC26660]|uniref:phage tail protein n=1 Tax=Variovorax sp. PAMC26660 TaxID=2762322 RepID=UPI00164E374F|nr:phage tail protein [Variovorax sp. PAMC26660]QNK67829.1 tail fiber protein [Variovorax sp. PAMC26660]
MPAPPARAELSAPYPAPSSGQARAGMGKLWDWLTGLLGVNGGTPAEARAALGAQLEPGIVSYTAASTPPAGWLKRNGAAVSVAAYPGLAAAIYCGDTNNPTALFGYRTTSTSAPSTNRSIAGQYIVLPDGRGEFDRGWDDARGVDVGRVFGSAQGDAFRAHNHGISGDNVFGTAGTFSYYPGPGRTPHTSEVVGGAETRPRNVAYLPIIKY